MAGLNALDEWQACTVPAVHLGELARLDMAAANANEDPAETEAIDDGPTCPDLQVPGFLPSRKTQDLRRAVQRRSTVLVLTIAGAITGAVMGTMTSSSADELTAVPAVAVDRPQPEMFVVPAISEGSQRIEVWPLSGSPVSSALVAVGDEVVAGAPLVRINRRRGRMAVARAQASHAESKRASRDLQRAISRIERGHILAAVRGGDEVESVVEALTNQDNNLERDRLALADHLARLNAEVRAGLLEAPVTGRVEQVGDGVEDPAAVIVRTDRVRFIVRASPGEVLQLTNDQTIALERENGGTLSGRVVRLERAPEGYGQHTVRMLVELTTPAVLEPGAVLEFTMAERSKLPSNVLARREAR